MNALVNFALLLLGGFVGGKLVNRLRLPAVTGYLLAGVVMGGSVLNLIGTRAVSEMGLINNVALGLIAFIIGGEFSFANIKKLGNSVMIIAMLEVTGAFVLVTLTMALLFRLPLSVALLLGAISSATAPAATVLVLRELKARGPLTDTLLAVVAIDDALCVMAFGLASAAAKALAGRNVSLALSIIQPLLELGGSIVFGAVLGVLLALVVRRLRQSSEVMVVALGTAFLAGGVSPLLHLSPLLTTMALGCTLVNVSREQSEKAFSAIKSMDTPVYVAFFTMAGASLELNYLVKVGLVGLGYILARVAGKALGAYTGATIGRATPAVRKYLGLGLVPQAGVAIGVTMLACQEFPKYSSLLATLTLGSVVVYELVGPLCAKIAVYKAGEAGVGGVHNAPVPVQVDAGK